MTTSVTVVALNGANQPIAVRANQNSDNSVALRSAIEVSGDTVSSSNPIPTNQAPTALTNSAAGTMGTSASIIVPASGTRKWLMITNRSAGSETQDIGSSNVIVGGGIPLAPGGGFLFNGAGAAGPIYGITTVSGSPFSYVEG
jgi:hypothetical protein